MTANVSIVTSRRDDVIRIPAQALRFVPHGVTSQTVSSSSATDPVNPKPNRARIWVRHGYTLKAVEVTTGLKDGNYVEIVSGNLKLGEKVVIDEKRRARRAQEAAPPRLSS